MTNFDKIIVSSILIACVMFVSSDLYFSHVENMAKIDATKCKENNHV